MDPVLWFTKILALHSHILHCSFLLLFSPFLSIFSLLPDSIHRAVDTEQKLESAVCAAARAPVMAVRGGANLVKRVVYGFLGAVYMCMVMLCLLIVAAILGVGFVRIWLEEPVIVQQRLHFDYTEVHPSAVAAFRGVPVGHTSYVSLVFLMPESDYNREMGMFQVTAELMSTNGMTISRSSHPCMLRFRSRPIRTVRTLIMAVPLVLGITAETQTIKIATLKHREGFPRTGSVRISLVPRAGTFFLPQLYEAEIVLKSQLPWTKELLRRWKWTFYVWVSSFVYAILLLILLCCFNPMRLNGGRVPRSIGEEKPWEGFREDERGFSETVRRWQEYSRRKAMLLRSQRNDEDDHRWSGSGSAATSMSMSNCGDEDVDSTGDSASVCYKGE